MFRILFASLVLAAAGCGAETKPTEKEKPRPTVPSRTQRLSYAGYSAGSMYNVTTDAPRDDDDPQVVVLLKALVEIEGNEVQGEIFSEAGSDARSRRYTVLTPRSLNPMIQTLERTADGDRTTYRLQYAKDPQKQRVDEAVTALTALEARTVADDKEARARSEWRLKDGSMREVLATVTIENRRLKGDRLLGGRR